MIVEELTKQACPYLTIDAIRSRFDDHWILLNEITKDPETDQIVGGQVIAAEQDRDRIHDLALELRDPWGLRDVAVICTKSPPPDMDFLL